MSIDTEESFDEIQYTTIIKIAQQSKEFEKGISSTCLRTSISNPNLTSYSWWKCEIECFSPAIWNKIDIHSHHFYST